MNASIPFSERERLDKLRRHLGDKLDDYLCDGYQAVALHSSSTIFAVNQIAADLFGYSIDELVPSNAWLLFPPQSVEALMQHLVSKSTESYTVTARRKDGSLFRVELKGRDFEHAGEPVRAVLLRAVD
jgi:PAS domain S-box-containing protein